MTNEEIFCYNSGIFSVIVRLPEFSWWQKLVSTACTVFLLAPLLVQGPRKVGAAGTEQQKEIVVILVEDSLFQGNPDDPNRLSGKIYRYAREIQEKLPETKTMVLPIPSDTSPGEIFSALEYLYLEGQKQGETLFLLSGVVFVGDLPLPVVRSQVGDFNSIFPFTDFEDPAFLWNEALGLFEKNPKNKSVSADIFHGVIRAPNQSEKSEQQWLSDFFDKNHDLYSGKIASPEKSLLVVDLPEEFSSQSDMRRNMYRNGQTIFAADQAFYRYNDGLFKDVNNGFWNTFMESIGDTPLPPKLSAGLKKAEETLAQFSMPDSLTRLQIQKLLPSFSQTVSGFLGTTKTKVRATGRWSMQDNSVDTMPVFITQMDKLSSEFLRKYALEAESKIVRFAEENWQVPIAMVTEYENSDGDTAAHYLHGRPVSTIVKAEDCSLFRGARTEGVRSYGNNEQLTEMNHLFNKQPNNPDQIYNSCGAYGGCCLKNFQTQNLCLPNTATIDVFDFQGGQNGGRTGRSGGRATFLDCQVKNFSGSPKNRKTISSVIEHNEPRPETISAAIAKGISGDIPADEDRMVTFQGPSGEVVEVVYPDFFDLVIDRPLEATDAEVDAAITTFLNDSEDRVRLRLLQSNVAAYIKKNTPPNRFSLHKISADRIVAWEVLTNTVKDFTKEEDAFVAWKKALSSQDPDLAALLAEKITEAGKVLPLSETRATAKKLASGGNNTQNWFPASLGNEILSPGGSVPFARSDVAFPANWVFRLPPRGFLYNDLPKGNVLREFVRWRSLTIDQKHRRALQILFAKDTPTFLPNRNNGYELATFRANGNAKSLWWGGESLPLSASDSDAEWKNAQRKARADRQRRGNIQKGRGRGKKEEIDECTGKPFSEGVNIFKWLDAMSCWMDKTMSSPVGITFQNSYGPSSDVGLDLAIDFGKKQESFYNSWERENLRSESIGKGANNRKTRLIPKGGFYETWEKDLATLPKEAYIDIQSKNGHILPRDTETDITIRFLRADGTLLQKSIPFSVAQKGEVKITSESLAENTFSQNTFSGEYTLRVKASGAGSIVVSANGFTDATIAVDVVSDAALQLEPLARKNGDPEDIRRFLLRATNKNGKTLSSFFGKAFLSVSDFNVASPKDRILFLKNGVAEVIVQQKIEASFDLSATTEGFSLAKITVGTRQNIEKRDPNKEKGDFLKVKDPAAAFGIGEKKEVKILVFDANNREIKTDAEISLTPTKKNAEMIRVTKTGKNTFVIEAGKRAGKAQLIARSKNLAPLPIAIPIVVKITADDLSRAPPNALISTFLGADFSNFSRGNDPLANRVLFAGASQAVLSATALDTMPEPRFSVFSNGATRLFDKSVRANFSSLSPPRIRLIDQLRSKVISEYELSFSEDANFSLVFDPFSSEKKAQISVQNLDRSETFSIASFGVGKNQELRGSFAGKTVFTVDKKGSIKIFDNQFIVVLSDEEDEKNVIFDIFRHDKKMGRLFYANAHIKIVESPAETTLFFPVRGNKNGNRGFWVTNPERKTDLVFSGKNIARAKKNPFPLYNADDNFALQIAAGVSAGKSAMRSVSPTTILLGDPTVALPRDNHLVAGYARGTGEEIARLDGHDITDATLVDFDADGFSDIVLSVDGKQARLLRNGGNLNFRDFGNIFESEKGLLSPAPFDGNNDGYEGVAFLQFDGQLAAFENDHKTILRKKQTSLPEGFFSKIQRHDFDNDGLLDVLGFERSGELSIFWGNRNNEKMQKTVLGTFGAIIETGNLAKNNTFVSVPNPPNPKIFWNEISLTQKADKKNGLLPASAVQTKTTEEKNQNILENTALFIGLDEFPLPITVSLLAEDINGGALQKDDAIGLVLRLQNNGKKNLHFSLAHKLSSAISVLPGSLTSDGSAAVLPNMDTSPEGDLVLSNISIASGETISFHIRAISQAENPISFAIRDDLSFPGYPADGKSDVSVFVPGLNGLFHMLSTGNRQFVKYFDDAGEVKVPDFILDRQKDADGSGLPDFMEVDKNNDRVPDYADQFFAPYRTDTDNDGLVDAWDDMNGVYQFSGAKKSNGGEKDKSQTDLLAGLGNISDAAMSYSECNAGCLNIPLNFAFLVPGDINIFKQIAGLAVKIIASAASGIASGAVSAAGGALTKGLDQKDDGSDPLEKKYGIKNAGAEVANAVVGLVSRIAGAVAGAVVAKAASGVVALVRKALGISTISVPKPFYFPIIGLLEVWPYVCTLILCYPDEGYDSYFRLYLSPTLTMGLGIGLCENLVAPYKGYCMAFSLPTAPFCDLQDDAGSDKRGVLGISDINSRCQLIDKRKTRDRITAKSDSNRGIQLSLDSLGSFSYSFHSNSNRRVIIFPMNWVYRQIEEFKAMFTEMPQVIVYYPDFTAINHIGFQKKFDELISAESKVLDEFTPDKNTFNFLDNEKNSGRTTQKKQTGSLSSASQKQTKETDYWLETKGWFSGVDEEKWGNASDAEKEQMIQKAKQETQKDFQNLNDYFDKKLNSIEDLYNAVSKLPLLRLTPVVVPIRLPYMSRLQILSLMSDLEDWKADAEKELQRVKKSWLDCDAATDLKDCDLQKAAANKITVNIKQLIDSVDQNIRILKSYLELPKLIAGIDGMIAGWLNNVLRYIDQVILFLPDWFLKNKKRLEDWIELWYLIQDIIKLWKKLSDIFEDYEKLCSSFGGCKVDRGELTFTVFSTVMDVVVSFAVIKFPRLPDIIIDISQIKGNITLPVPQPQIQFVPILFPKIPRLRLPDRPNINIQLPTIPLLPDFMTAIPTLPFPPVPKITLPDLPPAPTLPELSDAISAILDVIRVVLIVYCIYKGGLFPHQEWKGLKAVIEAMTARSVLPMLPFDFSGKLNVELSLPSVREIRIETQVNLDLNLGDSLVTIVKDIAKPINNATTDLRNTVANPVSALSAMKGKQFQNNPLASEIHRIIAESLAGSRYSPSELRRRMGKTAILLPNEHPALPEMRELRGRVVALQEDFLHEEKTLLAQNDLLNLNGNFVADSQLASDVFSSAIETPLPKISSFGPPRERITFASIYENAKSSPSGSATEKYIAKDEVVVKDGWYASCPANGGKSLLPNGKNSEQIIFNGELANNIDRVITTDLDNDGDKDILLLANNRIFLKENYSASAPKFRVTTDPEIGNWKAYAGTHQAVKNIQLLTKASGVRVSFSSHFNRDLLGIEIVARERRDGFFWDRKNIEELRTALLLPSRFVSENQKQFSKQTITVGQHKFSGQILVREFRQEYTFLPLPSNRFWHIQVREIWKGGRRSNFSETFFSAPQPEKNVLPPISLPHTINTATTLFGNPNLSFPVFSESGTSFINPLKGRENLIDRPGPQTIALDIPDGSGNTRREDFSFTVDTPDIFLEKDPLKIGWIKGEVSSLLANIPFVVLRERDGRTQKLRSKSADENAVYRTETAGQYLVNDFRFDAGIRVRDESEKTLVVTDPQSGRPLLSSSDISFAIKDGSIVLVDDRNSVPFLQIDRIASGNSDVILLPREINAENATALPKGVFATDRDKKDSFVLRNIPNDAPSFPGGAALVSLKGLAVAVSPFGKIHIFDESMQLRVKKTHSNADPLVLEVVQNGRAKMDIWVKVSGENIFLHTTDENGNITSIPFEETLPDTLLAAAGEDFSDVPAGHPQADVISFLREKGMIDGYADGSFRPEELVSRAEFVKMTLSATQCQNCNSGKNDYLSKRLQRLPLAFPDVLTTDWFAACVRWAKYLGLIQGYEDGRFDPQATISRAEAVAILLRAAQIPLQQSIPGKIVDIPKEAWYRDDIFTAATLGFLPVYFGYAYPEEKVTRGEFATMSAQILQTYSCRAPEGNNLFSEGLADKCPTLPEDYDGIDDEDGCPEFSVVDDYSRVNTGIHVTHLRASENENFLVDFTADIRENDILSTAIVNPNGTEIFSQSERFTVPVNFSPR